MDIDRPDDSILASMKSKTRYNIGLSRRRGVRVVDAPFERLDEWYALYSETAARQGLVRHDEEYFRTLLRLREGCKQNCPEFHLLMAEADGAPLAGIILALYGPRATYLYGASTREKKECMPSYALQWKAMQLAKRRGCTHYDLFGVPPANDPAHRMHGLYRFKTGFGGSYLHKRGCWDYPFDPRAYECYMSYEGTAGGYYA